MEGGLLPGDELLIDAEGTHRPPLIVIALEPHLAEVLEFLIFVHVLRGDMTVIIDDRQRLCVLVIELPSGFIRQKKLF